MDTLYLGIDVGTSSVKLTCIDENGFIVATSSKTYECSEPHTGWREIDPEIWWDAICVAATSLGSKVDLSLVAGVGSTGQMHTTVLVDCEGAAVCPAVMWNDQRTIEMVYGEREWAKRAGLPRVADFLSTGVPALNLAWMVKNNNAIMEKASSVVCASDWVALKFGGHIGMDYCGASTTGLYDNASQTWLKSVCNHFGISSSLLPPVEPADEVIGYVSHQASRETGIPEGAIIVRGTGDNPAAAICTGCLTEGIPTVSLGTSGVLMYSTEGVNFPEAGKPVLFKWGDRLKTQTQLSMRSCGGAKEWFYGQILETDSYDLEDRDVEDPLYDMRDLLFYPHLSGEKVLHGCPSVRGAFLGIDLDTSRSDLQRALMEGAAFALRALKEAVPEAREWEYMRLVGGGAKNDFWSGVLASVLGMKLVRLESTGPGHGAALLALSALTGQKLEKTAMRVLEIHDEIFPNTEARKIYDQRFSRYMRIFDALDEIYKLQTF